MKRPEGLSLGRVGGFAPLGVAILIALLITGCSGGGNSTATSPTPTPPPTPPSGGGGAAVDPFSVTGSLVAARSAATETTITVGPLAGYVLVTGGNGEAGTPLSSAELYNPLTGTFSAVGNMTTARAYHTATLIRNGVGAGDVLIAGGIGSSGTPLQSAEIFNAITSSFVAVGNMTNSAAYHQAGVFEFGTQDYVLLAGGMNSSGSVNNATQVYDPTRETFFAGGTMKAARENFTMTNLAPTTAASTSTAIGILMVGGQSVGGTTGVGSSEVYNIGGSSTSTAFNGKSVTDASLPSSATTYNQTATLLPGAVGVLGGNTAAMCTNGNTGITVNSVLIGGDSTTAGTRRKLPTYIRLPPLFPAAQRTREPLPQFQAE